MKLLFILPYIPYPLDSGGNQATYNMIDKIREVYDVSMLLFVRTAKDEDAVRGLQKKWSDVTFFLYRFGENGDGEAGLPAGICPNTLSYRILDYLGKSIQRKKKRKIRKYIAGKLAENVCSATGGTFDFVRENSCLNKNVLDIPLGVKEFVYRVSRMGFDVVQVEFYECLPFVYLLPETVVKVFVQHEIRYIRNENEVSLFAERTPDDFYRMQIQKDMEIKALSRYDMVVALTEVDRQKMLQECPDLNIYVSPAVISLPVVARMNFSPARELVFIGSGAHFPNTDGLLWFCKEVMPILSRSHYRLNVVGVWSDETKRLLTEVCPDVRFTGFIDDLSGFLAGKISVVPIRIGSGMRMKILDSIVSCSPVVTTAKGCEGLPLSDGRNCFIADSPDAFAHAIELLMEDVELQRRFVEQLHTDFFREFKMGGLVERRMSMYRMLEEKISSSVH